MKRITCRHCKRFLFEQAGTVVLEGMVCPNTDCKATLNFKLINADTTKDLTHKFVTPERPPKTKAVEVS